MNAVARQFEIRPATREAVGVLVSLVGPSGTGKTFSALRLATGIQRTAGGEIDVIDTENGRALHYAERFKFNHLRFTAPFSPNDYLEAVRFCARRGSKTIIVDSMSHEHDGPGGVLEMHEQEMARMAGGDAAKAERVNILAWSRPKAARKRLINELLQLNVNLILTFRAKEKLKIVRGKDPVELGWQPICGDEFMYEMTLQCLLKPGAAGVPSWKSDYEGERAVMKLPAQFEEFFEGAPTQINEDLGSALAAWAGGGTKGNPELDEMIAGYAKVETEKEFAALEKKRAAVWSRPMRGGYRTRIKEAADAALMRVRPSAKQPDVQTWVTTLTGQTNLRDLKIAWDECSKAFGGMPPLDCESAFTIRREALEEA
jgi:hypothetical protein